MSAADGEAGARSHQVLHTTAVLGLARSAIRTGNAATRNTTSLSYGFGKECANQKSGQEAFAAADLAKANPPDARFSAVMRNTPRGRPAVDSS